MRAISSAIQRLPVESGVSRMTAAEWIMPPGETEGAESMAEIATRLTGRTVPSNDDDYESDPNHIEPQPISLDKAKQSASKCHFIGDNIKVFSEQEYMLLLKLADKVHHSTPAKRSYGKSAGNKCGAYIKGRL